MPRASGLIRHGRLLVAFGFLLWAAFLLFVDLNQQIGGHAGVVVDRPARQPHDHSLDLGKNISANDVSTAQIAGNFASRVAAQAANAAATGPSGSELVVWKWHRGKSCQNYANNDDMVRSLEESKIACIANDACVAIECPQGQDTSCTLRAVANLVSYGAADCYERLDGEDRASNLSSKLHPAYDRLCWEYPFQPVMTQTGQRVNIILVRSPFRSRSHRELYHRYKNDILFMGISSFEDYPLFSGNPYSRKFSADEYLGLFPGFLHMMREPEKVFPTHVKTILLSQSDFSLPDYPARDYSVPRKYDFTLSGSDQDVGNDCVGWSSFAKNWSFVKQSLEVMCGEYGLTGVLVATKDKRGLRACTIPDSCKGKMIQTSFLDQKDYFNYLKQSRFAFLPQVHDASPRVSTQALALDVPLLMNAHISGGWKYLNEKTGEFFHDMSDFRQSLEKILKGADVPYHYEPRKWVLDHYGNKHSGGRLLKFVRDNFLLRVKLPRGTTLLLT